MKKRNILISLFILLLGFCAESFAQDIIILKTGDEIKVKVEEIGLETVKYKKFENLTGPLYTIEKSTVFMIKYENGSKDVFQIESVNNQTTTQPQPTQQQNPTSKEPVVTTPKIDPPKILKYTGGGNVSANSKGVSSFEVKSIMSNYPDALAMYRSGRNLKVTGDVFEGIGYASILFMFLESKNNNTTAANSYAASAVSWLFASLIVEGIGKSRIKESIKLYNSKTQNSTSYHFNIQPQGVGIAIQF